MCDKNALGEPAEGKTEKKNNKNNCPIEWAPPSEKTKEAEEKFENEVLGE